MENFNVVLLKDGEAPINLKDGLNILSLKKGCYIVKYSFRLYLQDGRECVTAGGVVEIPERKTIKNDKGEDEVHIVGGRFPLQNPAEHSFNFCIDDVEESYYVVNLCSEKLQQILK